MKILNSNSQNPYLLWDNSTRTQLLEYLEDQRTNKFHITSADPQDGSDFQYTTYGNELKVGDVYLRIYNEQCTFPLEVSSQFHLFQNILNRKENYVKSSYNQCFYSS